MVETFWILLIAQAFISAGFCAYLAGRKGENDGAWLILGFAFGLIALITLGLLPTRSDVRRVAASRPLNDQALRGTDPNQTRLCDWCLSEIRIPARVCPYCRAKYSDDVVSQHIHSAKARDVKSDSSPTGLHEAIRNNDVTTVNQFVDKGYNLNTIDSNYMIPVVIAVQKQNHDLLRILLEGGADPDGSSVVSPLVHAVDQGDLTAVDLLIRNGANPNKSAYPPQGGPATPLQLASMKGDVKMAQYLLNNGAKFNGYSGTSPEIVLAASGGHLMMIRLLLAKGGCVGGWERFPLLNSAYRAAYFGGHKQVAEFIRGQLKE